MSVSIQEKLTEPSRVSPSDQRVGSVSDDVLVAFDVDTEESISGDAERQETHFVQQINSVTDFLATNVRFGWPSGDHTPECRPKRTLAGLRS